MAMKRLRTNKNVGVSLDFKYDDDKNTLTIYDDAGMKGNGLEIPLGGSGPTPTTPNLEQVLTAGNTANNDILLGDGHTGVGIYKGGSLTIVSNVGTCQITPNLTLDSTTLAQGKQTLGISDDTNTTYDFKDTTDGWEVIGSDGFTFSHVDKGQGGGITSIQSSSLDVQSGGSTVMINLKAPTSSSAVNYDGTGHYDVKIDGTTITKNAQGILSASASGSDTTYSFANLANGGNVKGSDGSVFEHIDTIYGIDTIISSDVPHNSNVISSGNDIEGVDKNGGQIIRIGNNFGLVMGNPASADFTLIGLDGKLSLGTNALAEGQTTLGIGPKSTPTLDEVLQAGNQSAKGMQLKNGEKNFNVDFDNSEITIGSNGGDGVGFNPSNGNIYFYGSTLSQGQTQLHIRPQDLQADMTTEDTTKPSYVKNKENYLEMHTCGTSAETNDRTSINVGSAPAGSTTEVLAFCGPDNDTPNQLLVTVNEGQYTPSEPNSVVTKEYVDARTSPVTYYQHVIHIHDTNSKEEMNVYATILRNTQDGFNFQRLINGLNSKGFTGTTYYPVNGTAIDHNIGEQQVDVYGIACNDTIDGIKLETGEGEMLILTSDNYTFDSKVVEVN